jgi:pilin isopeptide linkage protein
VDTEVLAADKAVTLTNKAILTDNDYLPEGGVTATGDVTIPATGSSVVSKSQASTGAPAYVQFALNINENALDLVQGEDTVVVDDVMGEGMTLATLHENCVKVYDVTTLTDILDEDGNVDVSKVAKTELDITSQCTWKNVTTDLTKPTYKFTVPDSKHVVIVYWASFNGVDGQKVSLTNTAYFSYEGKDYSNNSSAWSGKVTVNESDSNSATSPYFFLQKTDENGNNVAGATFKIEQYDPNTKTWSEVARRTTTDGAVAIGHYGSSDTFQALRRDTIYRLVEVSTPVGYVLDSTEHYFEFPTPITGTGADGEVTKEDLAKHAEEKHAGFDVTDVRVGATYPLTNTFTGGTSYQIPVAKTINGKILASDVEFSFTLKPSGDTVAYTKEDYSEELTDKGITTTIKITDADVKAKSDTALFDTLYFRSAGEYTFTLTENDLSSDASDRGYSKDNTTYTVTVVVGEDKDANKLVISSVTYSGNNAASGNILDDGAVPTFNNTLSLQDGELTLQVKKTVSGRSTAVKAGEFSFKVTDNSTGKTVKDVNGNEVFTTEAGGLASVTIPVTQDDIGTKWYIISEVVPAEADKNPNITYSASSVIAEVTVGEVSATDNGGTAGVKATSVEYFAGETENGVPLMVNGYKATGSITLTGTKTMTQINTGADVSINKGEFTFTVKEGNSKVATGSTKADGTIEFTQINYVTSDVGEHTYTITEDKGNNVFVDYSKQSHTVKVNVTDDGEGHLNAAVTEVDGNKITDAKYVQAAILFHNVYTLIVPSGIRMDFLPYVLVVLLAGGLGAATILRRRKQRKHHA